MNDGPPARLRLHSQLSSGLTDEPVDDGQTQTRALGAGGKERFPGASQSVSRHPRSVIGKTELDAIPHSFQGDSDESLPFRLDDGRLRTLRGFALLGQSLPIFWIGIVLIFVFAANLQWLPAGTKGEGFISFKHLVLPTITLAWFPAASYLRITRTAMLEVMDSEYVKLARAKGVGRYAVWWKHAFRNAIIPPLTLSVFVLFGLMNGTVIVETVFSWPGLGRLAIQALQATDFPLLAGITIIYGGLFLIGILMLDIMYAFLDPRIKYS